MRGCRGSAALAVLLGSALAGADDLSKIDRTLAKEPTYQSKNPTYCLLVFGPEAKMRRWLVHDGNDLYVDRNGNGDLTEPGEKVAASGGNGETSQFHTFIPGPDGKTKHSFQVDFFKSSTFQQQERGPLVALVSLAGTENRTFGAWGDETGMLVFAPRPREAPVVHIDGPLQMGFECHLPLMKKSKGVYELNVGVGTKGVGRGSFAHLKYWNGAVPDGLKPRAVLEFPNQQAGGPPVRVEVVLGQRC